MADALVGVGTWTSFLFTLLTRPRLPFRNKGILFAPKKHLDQRKICPVVGGRFTCFQVNRWTLPTMTGCLDRTRRRALTSVLLLWICIELAESFPICQHVENGALNVESAKSTSCMYLQCTDKEAIIDIPVDLLHAYKDYSYMVLVTVDGCTVREIDKREHGGMYFIRLEAPYNACNTRKTVLPGHTNYLARSYISYIGEDWRKYPIESSCLKKGVEASFSGDRPVPTTCEPNPCLNEGTCSISPQNRAVCSCRAHASGYYCDEIEMPENGVYRVTTATGENLISIVAFTTTRLSEDEARRVASHSQFQDALLEITSFSNLISLRVITGCPGSPLCYGWLRIGDDGKIDISQQGDGAYLWKLSIEAEGYLLSAPVSGSFIGLHPRKGLVLTRDSTLMVVFHLELFTDPVFSRPHVTLPLKRAVLRSGGEPPRILLGSDRRGCSWKEAAGLSFCVWYRTVLDPTNPPTPVFSLYSGVESTDKPSNENWLGTLVAESVSENTVEIVAYSSKNGEKMAASEPFERPYPGVRHHLCVQKDAIYLDGTPFILGVTEAWREIFYANTEITVEIGSFTGQLDGFDLWCDTLASEVIFTLASHPPECTVATGSRGSYSNPDSVRVRLAGNVAEVEVFAKESSCQYCKVGEALHHGLCYGYEGLPLQSPSGPFHDSTNKFCESRGASPSYMKTASSQNLIARYADAATEDGGMVWAGAFLDRPNTWKWSADGTEVQVALWGYMEERLDVSDACAVYKPSKHKPVVNIPWPTTPLQIDTVSGPASENSYVWGVEECSEKHPFVCVAKSSSLSPYLPVEVNVFLTGGTIVKHYSNKHLLNALKAVLAEMVEAISHEIVGDSWYYLYENNLELRTVASGSKDDFMKVLREWQPREGENSIASVLPALKAMYGDKKKRNINIVVVAYPENLDLALPKSTGKRSSFAIPKTTTTFALGMMFAPQSLLQTMATPPSCYAAVSRDWRRERQSIALQFVSCVQGPRFVDGPFIDPAGRSFRFSEIRPRVAAQVQPTTASGEATSAPAATGSTAPSGGSTFTAPAGINSSAPDFITTDASTVEAQTATDSNTGNPTDGVSTNSVPATSVSGTTVEVDSTSVPADISAMTNVSATTVVSTGVTTEMTPTRGTTNAAPTTAAVSESSITNSNTTDIGSSASPAVTEELIASPMPATSARTSVWETTRGTVEDTSAEVTTIPATTSAPTSSVQCASGYEGQGCVERTSPRPGMFILIITFDIGWLFPALGRRRRATTTSLSLHLVEMNGNYAIRTLRGCPDGTYCLWWLNVVGRRVVFVSPDKGYHLWNLIPQPQADKYLIQSASSGLYVYSGSSGFYLTTNITVAMEFTFKSVPGNATDVVSEPTLTESVIEFFDHSNTSEAYISVPTNTTESSKCSQMTLCFAFRATNSSPVSFPDITFSHSSGNVTLREESISASFVALKIKDGNKDTTHHFPPLQRHWHHVCIQIHYYIRVFIDSMKLNVVGPSNVFYCPTEFRLADCSKTNSGKCFLGYIRRINVWSGLMSRQKITHIFKSTCEDQTGDLVASDQQFNGVGIQKIQEIIPSSACRYCDFDWVLAGDSCLHITKSSAPVGIEENNCAKIVDNASYPVSVGDDAMHAAVASLIEGTIDEVANWPVISYLYNISGYEWITFGSPFPASNKTYWGPKADEVSLTVAKCVIYSPTKVILNGNALSDWPSAVPGVLPRPRNFMWHRFPCSLKRGFVCQKRSDLLPPGEAVQVTIVMPNFAPLPDPEKGSFQAILLELLGSISSGSAVFAFVEANTTLQITGPDPAQKLYIQSWNQTSSSDSLWRTLDFLSLNGSVYAPNATQFVLVVVQKICNFTTNLRARVNPSVKIFVLGLQITNPCNLSSLASSPEYAKSLSSNPDSAFQKELKTSFQRFLQGVSVRQAVNVTHKNNTDSPQNNTACVPNPCEGGAACNPAGLSDFNCDCPKTRSGKKCEFSAPGVTCSDTGLTVEVPVTIIQSLSGTPNSTTPKNVLVYFSGRKNDTKCYVGKTSAGQNTTDQVYRLFVPVPFASCGVVVENPATSQVVTISAIVVYEKITGIALVDTSVVVANLTCIYTTKYGIGLRPDELVSAEFRPAPNKLFSDKLLENGSFTVLLQFYLDANRSIPLPTNPAFVVGTFVHASMFSKLPLPMTMALRIDHCYLSPAMDPSTKTSSVGLIKDNCAVSNGIPKAITSVEKDAVSFKFQVFKWKGGGPQLFLHCKSKICDLADDPSCSQNCTAPKTRRRRQLGRGDNADIPRTVFTTTPIRVKQTPEKPIDEEPYLVSRVELYPYILAGLLLFTFLFFALALVIVLHCLRLPSPEKYAMYSKCSYRPGGSISGSIPRAWTVVHAAAVTPRRGDDWTRRTAKPACTFSSGTNREQVSPVDIHEEGASTLGGRALLFSTFLDGKDQRDGTGEQRDVALDNLRRGEPGRAGECSTVQPASSAT